MNPLYPDHSRGYTLRWKPAQQILRNQVPAGLLDWLLDTASLTRRLQVACPGGFSVKLLHQGWGRPRHDEIDALGMRASERAIIREVQLLCNGTPWVYARTIIPVSTLTGRQRQLRRLGTKPLGAVLFADPTMRRSQVQVARISKGMKLYADASRGLRSKPADIWGRRSLFHVDNKPLLVAEIFLPNLNKDKHGLMVHYR